MLEEKRRHSTKATADSLLRECESAIERLMTDRRYFARPSRTLFNNVRPFFSIGDLPRVYVTIDRNIAARTAVPGTGAGLCVRRQRDPRHCHAMTRKGQPCQRQPLPGERYCPSHQHLTETFEDLGAGGARRLAGSPLRSSAVTQTAAPGGLRVTA